MTIRSLTIHPQQREARLGGEPLSLGARAFGVLQMLHENAGQVVRKQDLLDGVWGGLAVEEGNLAVQISALRRALGTDMIRTIPGVGYMLAQGSAPPAPHGPSLPDVPSLVALPFTNLTGVAEREYLVDGIVTDLVSALSRLSGLFIIAAATSFRYKGVPIDLKAVGAELGVRYVLEGAIQEAGGRLRIHVQLVEAATGRTIWSDRIEGSDQDLFDLQDQLTEKVAGAVEPTLLLAEAGRYAENATDNLQAYDLYLKARPQLVRPPNREAFDEAMGLLDRALALDPGFALAKAWKCRAFMFARGARWVSHEEVEHLVPLARELMANHLEEPVVLAFASFVDAFLGSSKDAGLQAARTAVRLSPNSVAVLSSAGWVESYAGHFAQAVELFQRAVRLDPIGYFGAYARMGWGIAEVNRGEHDRGIEILKLANAEAPGNSSTLLSLVYAYWLKGDLERARSAAAEVRAVEPDISATQTVERLGFRQEEIRANVRNAFLAAGLPD